MRARLETLKAQIDAMKESATLKLQMAAAFSFDPA